MNPIPGLPDFVGVTDAARDLIMDDYMRSRRDARHRDPRSCARAGWRSDDGLRRFRQRDSIPPLRRHASVVRRARQEPGRGRRSGRRVCRGRSRRASRDSRHRPETWREGDAELEAFVLRCATESREQPAEDRLVARVASSPGRARFARDRSRRDRWLDVDRGGTSRQGVPAGAWSTKPHCCARSTKAGLPAPASTSSRTSPVPDGHPLYGLPLPAPRTSAAGSRKRSRASPPGWPGRC